MVRPSHGTTVPLPPSAYSLRFLSTGLSQAAGVIFQMGIMTCYSWLLIEFAYRFLKNRPTTTQLYPFAWLSRRKAHRSSSSSQHTTVEAIPVDDYLSRHHGKLMLLGLSISTLFVFVRSIYRCPELLAGWTGPIIENQTLFDILDGAMIVNPSPAAPFLPRLTADDALPLSSSPPS